MNRDSLFGGNPWAVLIRLALLSIVVGIVLSALDITPANLVHRLQFLIRRVYDLGFGAFEWLFRYLVLGAIVVVPIWLIARLLGGRGRGDGAGDGR